MEQDFDKTALLVMDVQLGIIDRIENKNDYLTRLNSVVDSARQKNILIIYVMVGFRSGYPEISSFNKSFSTLKDESLASKFINPQSALSLTKEDIIVQKRRISAFSGSDLELILRARSIDHLVLSGISSSGVVLSTLRQAADKDFRLTVLSDLCVDHDNEVQEVLLEKIFPRQANVITSDKWINNN